MSKKAPHFDDCDLETGMTVVVKPTALERFTAVIAKKLDGRQGVVENVYRRIGSKRTNVRVLWLNL